MKVIETVYNGYRFRSRLEARWAVFFDALEVKYEYEIEGYDLDGIWYLPDFWLPMWHSWVEIKPDYPSEQEIDKCRRLFQQTKKDCIVIWGQPWAALHHKYGSGEYYDYHYRAAKVDSLGLGEHRIFTECRRCPAIKYLMVGDGSNSSIPEKSKEIVPLLTDLVIRN